MIYCGVSMYLWGGHGHFTLSFKMTRSVNDAVNKVGK